MRWKGTMLTVLATLFLTTGCGVTGGAGTSGAANISATNSTASPTAVSTQEKSPLLNKQAPSFTMEVYNGNGKTLSLKQILQQGEPVILNAFASWCPPCNQEAPDLKKLQEQYKGKIKIIGVDMTNYDSLSGLKSFVNKYKLPYSVLLDKKSVMAQSYNVAAYPTTFGISPSGKVVAFHLGYMTKQDMQNLAKTLLK